MIPFGVWSPESATKRDAVGLPNRLRALLARGRTTSVRGGTCCVRVVQLLSWQFRHQFHRAANEAELDAVPCLSNV